MLGLDPTDKKIFTAHQVYKMAGIDEFDFDELTFERQLKKTKA